MSAAVYLKALTALLSCIQDSQLSAVQAVGARIGESVAEGGVVHLFGCGHSHLAAEEVFIRSGTLTTVRAIWPDMITDKLERVEGLGAAVLAMGDVRPGEVLFIISNSGINPLPIDVAYEAGRRGAVTVAVTSKQHSLAVPSRHSSGRRLFEVCDHVLDTCVPAGDALVELPGSPGPVGPASTVGAVALIHAAMVEAAGWLIRRGIEPPVRISRNMPGGDEHNDMLARRYRDRIPELG